MPLSENRANSGVDRVDIYRDRVTCIAVFLQFVAQGANADPQGRRGLGPIATGLAKRDLDGLLLKFR